MHKKIMLMAFIAFAPILSCTSANAGEVLKPPAFQQKIDEQKDEILLDVRTPEEFGEGHIAGAMNIDWNGDSFQQQAGALDKSKPVYVYCKSGKRSAAAAAKMQEMGFSRVYQLAGGISNWQAENLPVTK
jgi:thioredoxin 1